MPGGYCHCASGWLRNWRQDSVIWSLAFRPQGAAGDSSYLRGLALQAGSGDKRRSPADCCEADVSQWPVCSAVWNVAHSHTSAVRLRGFRRPVWVPFGAAVNYLQDGAGCCRRCVAMLATPPAQFSEGKQMKHTESRQDSRQAPSRAGESAGDLRLPRHPGADAVPVEIPGHRPEGPQGRKASALPVDGGRRMAPDPVHGSGRVSRRTTKRPSARQRRGPKSPQPTTRT